MQASDKLLSRHMEISGQHEFDLGIDPHAKNGVDGDPGRNEERQRSMGQHVRIATERKSDVCRTAAWLLTNSKYQERGDRVQAGKRHEGHPMEFFPEQRPKSCPGSDPERGGKFEETHGATAPGRQVVGCLGEQAKRGWYGQAQRLRLPAAWRSPRLPKLCPSSQEPYQLIPEE